MRKCGVSGGLAEHGADGALQHPHRGGAGMSGGRRRRGAGRDGIEAALTRERRLAMDLAQLLDHTEGPKGR